MAEVISPPVHVLDYGYQAPNPIQWSQAGAEAVQPITQAIATGNEARNRFLLSQVENQRAMELAKWQHSAQLQREQMRDQRMIQVARLRAQQQMDDLKEKGVLDDLKSKNAYLQRIGGGALTRSDTESDNAFGARIDTAIKTRMENNIQTDAKAAYSIQKQIAGYNTYLNDPRINNAVSGELNQALANPGVQAQARNLADTGLSTWLNKVAPDNAPVIQDALDKVSGSPQGPQNRDLILQRAGLKDAFDAYQYSALQQSAYAYLKATGSPAAKQVATANENLSILKQQLQDISLMPGDNGRMVPKPWWSQVQNTTDDMVLHDHLAVGPNAAGQTSPSTAASANPVSVPPTVNPVVPAAPVAVRQDPYADYKFGGKLILPGTPTAAAAAMATPAVIPIPHSVAPLAPALAAQWGVPVAPGPNPSPAPNPIVLGYSPRFSDGTPAYTPFMMPPPTVPAPVMPAPTVTPTNSIVPPMPALQAIPAAVKLNAPIPSNPIVFPMRDDNANNPYDPALQMMQMRNFYAP